MTDVSEGFCRPYLIVLKCLCKQRHNHYRDRGLPLPSSCKLQGPPGAFETANTAVPFCQTASCRRKSALMLSPLSIVIAPTCRD